MAGVTHGNIQQPLMQITTYLLAVDILFVIFHNYSPSSNFRRRPLALVSRERTVLSRTPVI